MQEESNSQVELLRAISKKLDVLIALSIRNEQSIALSERPNEPLGSIASSLKAFGLTYSEMAVILQSSEKTLMELISRNKSKAKTTKTKKRKS